MDSGSGSVHTPSPHLPATAAAFGPNAEIDGYLGHVRRVLAAVAARAVGILQAAGIQVLMPSGAFYLFLDFSPLADRLAGKRVRCKKCEAVVPVPDGADGEGMKRP